MALTLRETAKPPHPRFQPGLGWIEQFVARRPSKSSPRSSIPLPSREVLERSLAGVPFALRDARATEIVGRLSEKEETVLYLAYGSNLASRTFLDRRGIRPLSAVNVVVPELVMTFDLPGIPYTEPCFANSRYREAKQAAQALSLQHAPYENPEWSKGMVGVVYEVNLADYRHIIATEGGGSAYHDILVDCYPLAKNADTVPLQPSSGLFKAHTLFAPVETPETSSSGDRPVFSRPDPDYAQPSLRYLQLLRDGADEHNLPQEYKKYLHDLEPYTITSRRQEMGRFVSEMLWVPFIKLIWMLMAKYSDPDGKSPEWLALLMAAISISAWESYDHIFHPIFGDGERTQHCEQDEEKAGSFRVPESRTQ